MIIETIKGRYKHANASSINGMHEYNLTIHKTNDIYIDIIKDTYPTIAIGTVDDNFVIDLSDLKRVIQYYEENISKFN